MIYQPTWDTPPPKPGLDLGFGRFRLHAPINKPEYYDEICVFLGASYFRAVAKKGGSIRMRGAAGYLERRTRNQMQPTFHCGAASDPEEQVKRYASHRPW